MLISWCEWGKLAKADWSEHMDSRLQWGLLYENWSRVYLSVDWVEHVQFPAWVKVLFGTQSFPLETIYIETILTCIF